MLSSPKDKINTEPNFSWTRPLGPEKFMKSKSNSSKFLEYPHFDDNEGHIVGGFKGDWNLWSINENLCIV